MHVFFCLPRLLLPTIEMDMQTVFKSGCGLYVVFAQTPTFPEAPAKQVPAWPASRIKLLLEAAHNTCHCGM